MRYLIVVDLQKEFVKDEEGRRRYEKGLSYIEQMRSRYDCVVAYVYRNNNNPNMQRLLDWDEIKDPEGLEFKADRTYFHSGYSVQKSLVISDQDKVDVFGFDTDACVLATCFKLFDDRCEFNILTHICWSSGGEVMHDAGLNIMRRQFGKAVL